MKQVIWKDRFGVKHRSFLPEQETNPENGYYSDPPDRDWE